MLEKFLDKCRQIRDDARAVVKAARRLNDDLEMPIVGVAATKTNEVIKKLTKAGVKQITLVIQQEESSDGQNSADERA